MVKIKEEKGNSEKTEAQKVMLRMVYRIPMPMPPFLPVPSSEEIKDTGEDIREKSSATGGAENSVLDDKGN
ncbi:hypothetical protein CDAR_201321 [Caerostris darwini]|uniref:Uncharacterized protein n=1 Tax=Caerostris darwini TaxID=1538125 RepID=A0AAV4SRQ0_9ARAC|nr:hypothetical protein CDAR_201321 [Caerostris darwini]